jgi:hypothetical protein
MMAAMTSTGQNGPRFPDAGRGVPAPFTDPLKLAMIEAQAGRNLKSATQLAELIVEADVHSVFPGGRLDPDDAVFRITRYLKGCTPSTDVVVAREGEAFGTQGPEAFRTGDRYILFLNKHHKGLSPKAPDRAPFQRYDLMVYRPPDIKLLATNDMAHKRRLLIRVERSALQFIMGSEDPYWAYYHGADAGQFVTDIAALTGPSEKCFKQQAEAAAAKQREAQEKAAKADRKQAETDRKALEKAEKDRLKLPRN